MSKACSLGLITKKVDKILSSDILEKEYLIDKIDQYYAELTKNSAQIIKCNFKKKEIIAFYEYLTEDLGDGF
ncbi:MAG: hypothetical protein ACFFDN_13600 [Candidatus Hodarchaeota archaeon]